MRGRETGHFLCLNILITDKKFTLKGGIPNECFDISCPGIGHDRTVFMYQKNQ